MTMLGKLNFVTFPRIIKTEGPNGVKRPVTDVHVRIGDKVIATATLGGSVNAFHAQKEFKRASHRFEAQKDTTREMLTALAA